MSNADAFEGWAIVELMGHRRLVGYVREAVLAGAGVLRVDVLGSRKGGDELQQATQFYAPAALYSLTPVTEEMARAAARQPGQIHYLALPFGVAMSAADDEALEPEDDEFDPTRCDRCDDAFCSGCGDDECGGECEHDLDHRMGLDDPPPSAVDADLAEVIEKPCPCGHALDEHRAGSGFDDTGCWRCLCTSWRGSVEFRSAAESATTATGEGSR